MYFISLFLLFLTNVSSSTLSTRAPTQSPTPLSRRQNNLVNNHSNQLPPLNNDNLRSAVNTFLTGQDTGYGPISSWDTSRITNMAVLFYGDPNFNEDLSGWDVSNVTDMNSMFYMNTYFNGDIKHWNVSKVTDMYAMFFGCSAFDQDINYWDTSNVTNMSGMLTFAESFHSNLSQWDVSKVTIMDHMLYGAASFNQVLCWNVQPNTSAFDVLVGSSGSLLQFPQCLKFNDGDFLQAVQEYVGGSTKNGYIGDWDTSRVTDMTELFFDSPNFNDDISHWDVSSVTNMQDMFYFAQAFNSDISRWNTSNVTNMKGMFGGAWSFNIDISNWDVSHVKNMYAMFMNSKSFNEDLSSWNFSSVTDMRRMFHSASKYNQAICVDPHNKLTSDMFIGSNGRFSTYPQCVPFDNNSIRKAVDEKQYDNISQWDTSRVTDMKGLFSTGNDYFNANLNDWDVSNVTSMEDMFFEAEHFNSPLNQWNVSIVTNMRGMFARGKFNNDIGGWDVSKVEQMQFMFMNNKKFAQDIKDWDVTSVTNMNYMFYGASMFRQELCWDMRKKTDIGMSEGSQLKMVNCDPPIVRPKTFSPTPRPSHRKRTPAPTPVNRGTKSPTERPKVTQAPTPRTNLVQSVSLSPTVRPSSKPIKPSTVSPSSSPTLNPTKVQSLPPIPTTIIPQNPTSNDGVFYIQSDLSSSGDYWCLYANNNSLNPGVVTAIAECQNWNSFKWAIDYEGKIRNYKNLDLCINMKGQRVTIEYCVDGKPQQIWIYNSNDRRILSQINGYKALTVESRQAGARNQVKAINYSQVVDFSESWSIQYDFDNLSFSGQLFVPKYDTFRIVSHVSGRYCLFPANNSPVQGMKMAVSVCKTWKSFLWMFDNTGRLKNVKEPTMCMNALGMRLEMSQCDSRTDHQRFAYSVFENKLVSLRYGKRQAMITLSDGADSYDHAQVKFSIQERSLTLAETKWSLEEF